jgi:DNA-binding transcriptional LysR family regulator
MNHTTLQIFKLVAETQSVTRAAKQLGRAQSNITTRIQQLEEDLGVELFVRGNKKMLLSPAGQNFLSYARRILSLAEEAKQALHPARPGGSLSLGAMEACAASRLPAVLPIFHQRCPQVDLTLRAMPTRQLTELVENATLDCALVCLPSGPDGSLQCPDALEYLPLFVEQLVLVTPSEDDDYRFAAFPAGCSYRQRGVDFLQQAGKKVEVADVGSYHGMIANVATGRYACLMPASVLSLLTLPVGSHTQIVAEAATQLIWRRGYVSSPLDALRQLLLETYQS